MKSIAIQGQLVTALGNCFRFSPAVGESLKLVFIEIFKECGYMVAAISVIEFYLIDLNLLFVAPGQSK